MNTLYPLKPNYTGSNKCWLAFCNHDTPVTWCYNVKGRTDCVQIYKPDDEQEVRAEHMVRIPDELIPKYLVRAQDAWNKAQDAYWKARDAWEKARDEREKAWEEWEKTRDAWKKAHYRAPKNPRILKYLKEHTPFQWDGKSLYRLEGKKRVYIGS